MMRTELTIIDLINCKHTFVAIEIQNKIELNRQLNQNLPTLDRSSEAVEVRRAA